MVDQQEAAVQSGYWPLYRYNPDLSMAGQNPFQLDSRAPKLPLERYIYREGRYRMLQQSDPERAAKLLELAPSDVKMRWEMYADMAADKTSDKPANGNPNGHS